MNKQVDFQKIGSRPVRPDGVDKVTGRALFGADFQMSDMAHGYILRSPLAHARINFIDTSAALEVKGVLAIVTGRDFPNIGAGQEAGGEGGGDMKDIAHNVMARDKVLYEGHAVAAVAATSKAAADEALSKIEVKYEALPPVMSLDLAMQPDAPLLHETMHTKGYDTQPDKPSNIAQRSLFTRGDVDAGFDQADVIVEGEFRTPTVHQGYIEPHACIANAGEDSQIVIWCSTQGHFDVRNSVAAVLATDINKIRVIPSEIGGGFGGKTTIYLEPLAALLSLRAGCPVKMTMTRNEVFRASGPASATRSVIRIGALQDGRIVAMKAWLAYEAGAFPGGPTLPGAMAVFAPYDVDNFHIEAFDVVVNKPKVAAYRAPGAPQSMYGSESLLNELAEKLGMDPIEFRLKNAVDEGTRAVYGPKFSAIGLKACLEAARRHPNYLEASRKKKEGHGFGVAVGFWFNVGLQSTATVHVNQNGSVTVTEGNPDIGGSRASMALMAAEELGIPYEDVRVVVADTDNIGISDVTGGSRVTYATGMAVIEAARKVKQDLCARAASLWNVEPEMVSWEQGCAVASPGVNTEAQPLTLAKLAASAPKTGGPIGEKASLNARGAGPSFSVNMAEVEVDKETGAVKVLKFTAIQDAGKAIHPSYVEGQMQGGAVQGIGWALNEEYIWDEQGVMLNPGFLDYRIPVASDLPMIDTQIVEVPNPGHPFGVRGVGETPIVAPLPAVCSAVSEAIGVRMNSLPLSPPRVLEAIDSAEK